MGLRHQAGGGERGKFFEGLIKELLARAEPYHQLLRWDPDKKKSRLQELKEQKDQTGVVGKEIRELPQIPDATKHIWDWFTDLNRHRQSNGMAPNPLSWADMDAYFRRFRRRPKPWELQALSRLDGQFLLVTAPSNKPAATGVASLRANEGR